MLEKKNVIDLPVKLVLTEKGTTFFVRQGKSPKKYTLADNVEENVLILERFTPTSLQRMMLVDYISKVEISKSEFMSSRQEIMDLSKLVVYSMLYRQYDSHLFTRVLSSEVVKKWNRLNPSSIIEERTPLDEAFLHSVLKDKAEEILEIKQRILAPLRSYITRNSTLLPAEKNIQLLLSEKYLNNMRPFTWFIVTKFKDADGFDTLMKEVRASLSEYMSKATIPDYVSLMIMELAMNAENANLKREAKAIFKGSVDMNAVLFDPGIRRQVFDSLERKGELVCLSWQLGEGNGPAEMQGRLQITLFNKGPESQKFKDFFNESGNIPFETKSLMDFYREIPGNEANTELGLYYLSYLSEACDKVNVKFESIVQRLPSSDLAVIRLSLII
jgi:hypothetical protein